MPIFTFWGRERSGGNSWNYWKCIRSVESVVSVESVGKGRRGGVILRDLA
jgi:hypothetical protein